MAENDLYFELIGRESAGHAVSIVIAAQFSGKTQMIMGFVRKAMKDGGYKHAFISSPTLLIEQNDSYRFLLDRKDCIGTEQLDVGFLGLVQTTAGRKLLIVDDFTADPGLSIHGGEVQEAMVKLCAGYRHFEVTIIMIGHTVRTALGKRIRELSHNIIVGRIRDDEVLDVIYKEFLSLCDHNAVDKTRKEALSEFKSMFIDGMLSVPYRFMICRTRPTETGEHAYQWIGRGTGEMPYGFETELKQQLTAKPKPKAVHKVSADALLKKGRKPEDFDSTLKLGRPPKLCRGNFL